MNPIAVLEKRAQGNSTPSPVTSIRRTPSRPKILIATIDPEIREALADLLEGAEISAVWVNGVEDVKAVVARERIAACLCGFWLQDGTYREVIRHLRRRHLEIPAIIVSAPSCPQQYRDYFGAMNLEALDFLCYPYQQSDLQKMLESAVTAQFGTNQQMNAEGAAELKERGAA
jgi:DNA-binding NtrC family response regulator